MNFYLKKLQNKNNPKNYLSWRAIFKDLCPQKYKIINNDIFTKKNNTNTSLCCLCYP